LALSEFLDIQPIAGLLGPILSIGIGLVVWAGRDKDAERLDEAARLEHREESKARERKAPGKPDMSLRNVLLIAGLLLLAIMAIGVVLSQVL
jgi:hypothetical protein